MQFRVCEPYQEEGSTMTGNPVVEQYIARIETHVDEFTRQMEDMVKQEVVPVGPRTRRVLYRVHDRGVAGKLERELLHGYVSELRSGADAGVRLSGDCDWGS